MAQTAVAAIAAERSTVLTQAVAETAKHLGLGSTDLAPIIGISQSSASRLLKGKFIIKEGTPEWQLSALLVRLYRGVFSIVGNSNELAQEWLTSRNQAFGDRAPLVEIKTIIGLVFACDYVDSCLAPDAMIDQMIKATARAESALDKALAEVEASEQRIKIMEAAAKP